MLGDIAKKCHGHMLKKYGVMPEEHGYMVANLVFLGESAWLHCSMILVATMFISQAISKTT